MKVPLSWLKEYVDFEATPQALADKLTFSGVEVEGIAPFGHDYPGVVVGEVLGMAAHPNADRLRLCRVTDGQRELPVVCGASNFTVGDKVALACVGAVLPGGLTIKRSKIRGELSEGMLCAEDELGLSDDHSGIMRFPSECVAGTPLVDLLGRPDTVLDLEITWNRPDCLSIIGIAREVAALCGSRLKRPGVDYAERGEAIAELATVALEDAAGCPRYTARVLKEVRLGPSPLWMQQRLRACGVRPINNVVDITNYVMLETGQPLHAFDYELLENHGIVVRRARPGEKTATLDGVERTIDTEMLMIADAVRPVAVAGVMGGAGSEIRETTTSVLLESACFDAPGIRRTAVALGLQTESSHRFERGVDIENADWASRRAAGLMVELAGACAARGVIDVYPVKAEQRRIVCRYGKLRELLGIEIPDGEIIGIFEALQLEVEASDRESCTVRVPSLRRDLEIEADLIEEVARIHGLDKVPAATPCASIVPGADDTAVRAQLGCRARLVGLGLTETMNYSFLSPRQLDVFSEEDRDRRVVLPNPVSAEHAVLRNSLIPQMVETLGRNLAHQTAQAACFEIGRIFMHQAQGAISEEERVAIGLLGPVARAGVGERRSVTPEEMFLWLKGMVEALCAAQHVADASFQGMERPYFESGWGVRILSGDETIGEMGLVSGSIRHKWRMSDPVPVAELNLGALTERWSYLPGAKEVSTYPAVNRDVSLIVKKGILHADIVRVIRAAAPAELTDVRLFDIFRSEGMGDSRSLAYSLTYRSLNRSLTDDEVNTLHASIKQAVRDKLDAEIRET